MIINTAGEYTLQYTATDACGNSTTVERDLVVDAPPIYGAEWSINSPSALARTDAAALFANPVPQYSDGNGGWVGGSSPFDDIMPWSGIEVVEDADAGTLVKIPKYYYMWTRPEANSMKLQISPIPQTGFLTSPAHANRGDGVGERDYVYVGRYHCSSVDYKSVTGVAPKGSTTRADFRSAISALGSDVWQYDFAMHWTILMLYLVEFANWNSQAMIGGGCSTSGNASVNNGQTDGMTYHTGTTNTQVGETDYGYVQYRHIENMWANMKTWCDGIYFDGNDMYCIKNPSNFGESDGVFIDTVGTSAGFTTKFNDPSLIDGFEYAMFPKSVVSSIGSSLTHDRYYRSGSSSKALLVGCGSISKTQDAGMFYFNINETYPNGYSGSRLMKLPSA